MAKERSLPSWTVDLAQGRAEALRGVAGELRRYFTICLAPHWGQVQLHIARDLAHRSQTMAQGGVEALLSTLVPGARWSPPVLELAYPFSHDIHLDGRGLLLQPAFFDHPSPSGQCVTTLVDQELTPVLVYTIDHPLGWMATAEPPNPPPGDPLAALLGSTRARVLCALARGMCTTSELARRAKAPLSTVSRQATILRDAGLIASHRDGNTVLHILTALGVSLCREHPPV
ncbi:ArsR/SmtB family transcription factor [Streptomyces orinoci]|uniref:Winged helix-turn-helix domain-containing protein n=1 Tax=Streptomyces orinoci TaxID=67339 RepID=A0ABV3K0R8_STRON|nr:winged helix-turn-helix domain-containing protein [Streptomyces orinoci]